MNAQLDFLGRLPAGSHAVETSSEAADRLTPDRLHARRLAVLTFVVACGERGATADEVAAAFEMVHNSVAPRLSDLLTQRLLERTAEKRRTRQGSPAFVHVASELGRRVVMGKANV